MSELATPPIPVGIFDKPEAVMERVLGAPAGLHDWSGQPALVRVGPLCLSLL